MSGPYSYIVWNGVQVDIGEWEIINWKENSINSADWETCIVGAKVSIGV
jgi:hypothetical protein